MLNVEDLTDAELRDELKTLGSNAGPITSTTRHIYEKKLTKLRQAKESNTGKGASNFSVNGNHTTNKKQTKVATQRKKFGFSSDESDDNKERKKLTKVLAPRRQHDASKGLRSKPVPEKVDSGVSRRTRSSKATLSPLLIKNGYSDDSSDSEGSWIQVQSADTNTSPGLLRTGPFSPTSRRCLSNHSSRHSSPLLPHDQSKTSCQDSVNAQIDSPKNTPSQAANANTPKTVYSTYHKEKNGRDVFRRRALSRAARQTVLDGTNDVLESIDADPNASLGLPPKKLTLFSRLFSRFHRKEGRGNASATYSHTEDTSSGSWSLHCSVLLPICTVVFFITLGLLYVTMRSDNVGSTIAPPMIESSLHQVHQERNQTMVIVNGIYEILGTVAGNVMCNVTNESDMLFVGQLQSRMKVDENTFFKALTLIRENPDWEIFLYKDSKGLELLKTERVQLVRFMRSKRPLLPTFCRFKRAVGKVLFRVSVVLIAGLLIWLVILYRQYRIKKKEDERRKMFVMVEQILDLLKKHHLAGSSDDKVEPFIPILHVRDMLISPQERKARAKEWEQAVKFISASESRIRVETQRIAGEDYRVWRWIQVTSPNKRQQPPGRVWQGEAFDTNRSVNAPNISPTPCLKIRNMFDPDVEKDANWDLQVQDSILEKCSDNNEIVSIVVEKNSKEGLVYVKCLSCSGAGKAFKSLHGSWFDGHLVTVKFIKLQRFHTRYPHTADLTTPLKPSSSTRVSSFLPPEEASSGFLTSTPLRPDA